MLGDRVQWIGTGGAASNELVLQWLRETFKGKNCTKVQRERLIEREREKQKKGKRSEIFTFSFDSPLFLKIFYFPFCSSSRFGRLWCNRSRRNCFKWKARSSCPNSASRCSRYGILRKGSPRRTFGAIANLCAGILSE